MRVDKTPTPRQLADLRRLAASRGVSFVPPPTRSAACRPIEQPLERAPSPEL